VPPLRAGLLSSQAHEANGSLFPQPLLRREGAAALMGKLVAPGWLLVLDGRADLATPAVADDVQMVRIFPPGAGAGWVEADGVVAAWFDRHQCHAALVRPDHYVFGVAADAAGVFALLREFRQRLAVPA